jgi:hypothetical protein
VRSWTSRRLATFVILANRATNLVDLRLLQPIMPTWENGSISLWPSWPLRWSA